MSRCAGMVFDGLPTPCTGLMDFMQRHCLGLKLAPCLCKTSTVWLHICSSVHTGRFEPFKRSSQAHGNPLLSQQPALGG